MTTTILDDSAIARLHRLGGDALVRQMIELYLEHGPARIAALAGGVSAGDATAVERAAHTLKSTAGNLGAHRLQETAGRVEAAAAEGRIDRTLGARMEQEYADSVTELRRRLEGLT